MTDNIQNVDDVNIEDTLASSEEIEVDDLSSKTVKQLADMSSDDLDKLLKSTSDLVDSIENPTTEEKKESEEEITEAPNKGGKVPVAVVKSMREDKKNAIDKKDSEIQELREELEKLKQKVEPVASEAPANDDSPLKDLEAQIDSDVKYLKRLADNYDEQFNKLTVMLDEGQITQGEFHRKQRDLDKQTNEIENAIKRRINGNAEQVEALRNPKRADDDFSFAANDPRLVQATEALMQDNEWYKFIPERTNEKLKELAITRMSEQKLEINPSDPKSIYNFRKIMVVIGRELGLDEMYQAQPTAAGAAAGGAKLSPEDLAYKKSLAAKMPPAITDAGLTEASPEVIDEKDVEKMSTQELSNLTPEALDRLAGKAS
jgi:hypothetical protein